MHQPPLQVDSLDIVKPGPWPWVIGLAALLTLAIYLSRTTHQIESTITSSVLTTVASAQAIGVDVTVDGRDVTLSGSLGADSDREKLIASIDGIEGVRVISDDIKIVDSRQKALVQQTQFRKSLAAVDASSVTFAPSSSSLSLSSESTLLRVAQLLKSAPERQLKIAGHTDNSGNADRNLELSRERAQTVADFLLARGVNRNQLIVQGYGPTQPLYDNSTESGRARNRRIEFIFMK